MSKATKKFLGPTGDGLFLKYGNDGRLVPGVVAKELARRKTAWARWITSKRRERMIVRIMKLVEKADQSALEAAIHELRAS